MIIRKAELRDLERLTEIFNYEVLNGTASFCIQPKTVRERLGWFEEHSGGTHPLIVAEADGDVAGYASLSTYREYEAYDGSVELSVYVDHRQRGKRIGWALMEEILKLARENEKIHTVISVITGNNDVSIRMHEALGFRYCGSLTEVGEKFGKKLDVAFYEMLV